MYLVISPTPTRQVLNSCEKAEHASVVLSELYKSGWDDCFVEYRPECSKYIPVLVDETVEDAVKAHGGIEGCPETRLEAQEIIDDHYLDGRIVKLMTEELK